MDDDYTGFFRDNSILAVNLLAFFIFGYLYFRRRLYLHTTDERNIVVDVIFAATFALSCALFQLIIFEIVDFLACK